MTLTSKVVSMFFILSQFSNINFLITNRKCTPLILEDLDPMMKIHNAGFDHCWEGIAKISFFYLDQILKESCMI